MATRLKGCTCGDRRTIRNAGGVVGTSDLPAADGDRGAGKIVKLDEFVSRAIRSAHAKLADNNVLRNGLDCGRETQEEHESKNRENHDCGRCEHTGLPG